MDRSDRALLHDPGEKGLVYGVELRWHPRRRNIDKTVRTLLVEPDHPVPQRLTIHATNLRRLFPRGPLEHGRAARGETIRGEQDRMRIRAGRRGAAESTYHRPGTCARYRCRLG